MTQASMAQKSGMKARAATRTPTLAWKINSAST
jgi:hypothetical protein